MIKNIALLVSFSILAACSTTGTWDTYRPPMSNLVGMEAKLVGEDLTVGGPIKLMGGKEIEITTRPGSKESSHVDSTSVNAALDVLVKKASVKVGFSASSSKNVSAKDLKIDNLENWAWVPEGQPFVYSGIRASSVTMEVKSDTNLSLGEISYPELGTVNISAKGNNVYNIKIDNPKVYYKIQMAEVKQTFSGNKYSNGWITMDSRGETNIPPIVLDESSIKTKETWEIQPYQYFWERWFSGYDMPQLSLMIEDGQLYIRSTRGLNSEKIPLDPYMKNNMWNQDSIFVTDFPVGDFERKLVVLDLKAEKKDGKITILHARIRYPEVKLNIGA
jgi:hypothetical protein